MTPKTGLDMVISIFVHYPELSSVKYETLQNEIKIEIALDGLVDEESIKRFITKTYSCLALLHKNSNVSPILINMDYLLNDEIAILRLYRDVKTLTEEEVELFIFLLRDSFTSLIIKDKSFTTSTEKSYIKEIKRTLLNKKNSNINLNNFFAFRDNGTMFVFNK